LEDFKGNIPQPITEKVMSTYDQIKAEGVNEGIEQGIEQGIKKGIEKAILNAFDNSIDLKTIQIITGENVDKINEVLRRNDRLV
jgi:hypothetical protein